MDIIKKNPNKIIWSLAITVILLITATVFVVWLFLTNRLQYINSGVFEDQFGAKTYYVAPPSPFLQEKEAVIIAPRHLH